MTMLKVQEKSQWLISEKMGLSAASAANAMSIQTSLGFRTGAKPSATCVSSRMMFHQIMSARSMSSERGLIVSVDLSLCTAHTILSLPQHSAFASLPCLHLSSCLTVASMLTKLASSISLYSQSSHALSQCQCLIRQGFVLQLSKQISSSS